jgi:hypothetical protein
VPDDSQTLDLTLMHVVHDAVRRDLVRMSTLLGGTSPLPAARVAAVQAQWLLVAGALEAHERAEDDVLWPSARRLGAELAELVDRSLAQHAAIDDAVALASTAVSGFDGRARRSEVAGAVKQATRLVDLHFAGEEQRLLPPLAEQLPPGEWATFVRAGESAAGPFGRDVMLPWMLQGAPPPRVATVLAQLGSYERSELESTWRPAYRERTAALWS